MLSSSGKKKQNQKKQSKTYTAGNGSCIIPLQESCLLEGSFISS